MSVLSFISEDQLAQLRAAAIPWQTKTQLLADCCRINTLYMIQCAGSGHIGSSFSSMDLVSYLLLNRLQLAGRVRESRDVFFSSKGHDVPGYYSVLMALGKLEFDNLDKLRRLQGLPGHPDQSMPYVYCNTGSLGMGISKAKGFVWARRAQNQSGQVVVLTGDGELQEGQFWESLVSAVNLGMHELTVVVDHNKIQSDTWLRDVSDLGDLPAKLAAFGWYCETCDGHDLAAIDAFFSRGETVGDRPKILVAHTQKGRGVSFMNYAQQAEGLYRFHSGALADEDYQNAVHELAGKVQERWNAAGLPPFQVHRREYKSPAVASPALQKLIPAYEQALMWQASLREDLVVLDADLVKDCGLVSFKKQYPNRFIECGIAEQDMVSQAGALALHGLLPLVHSFACFLSARPNEQIYNNATEGGKIIYVGSLAGLLPAGPGHSHQAVRDIAALSAVPGLIMIEPCTVSELEQALDFAVNFNPQSSYIRLVSIPWPLNFQLPVDARLHLGRGTTVREGAEVAVIGYGPVLLSQAIEAAEYLQNQHQISVKVIDLPWLNRLDEDWLSNTVDANAMVLTLDNHYVKGGQGEMIAAALMRCGYRGRVASFGIGQIPHCGRNDEVLKAHGLDWQTIAGHIMQLRKEAAQSHGEQDRTTTKLGS